MNQNASVGTAGVKVTFVPGFDKLEYLPFRASGEPLRGRTTGTCESLPISASSDHIKGCFGVKPLLEPERVCANTSIDPVKTLANRTRSKSLDWVVKGRLMNDATIKETSPLHQNYVKSTACNGTLTQEDGKIKAFYCKERWCSVCNRIRTGILFNKYEPVIAEWDDKYFVTLSRISKFDGGLIREFDGEIVFSGSVHDSRLGGFWSKLHSFPVSKMKENPPREEFETGMNWADFSAAEDGYYWPQ